MLLLWGFLKVENGDVYTRSNILGYVLYGMHKKIFHVPGFSICKINMMALFYTVQSKR